MPRQLRIAVDARPLERRLTGIGHYLANLLPRLARKGHTWFLLSSTPLNIPELRQVSNIVPVHCWNRFLPRSSNVLAQIAFPYWCRKNRIDLYWSPRHHLPRLLPRCVPSVVTIHDVVWKRVPETMTWQSRLQEACLMPFSVRRAEQILADSWSTKRDLVELFKVEETRITVVPLAGTLCQQGSSEASVALQGPEQPYILFIGTLEPRKNLRRLLAAFAGLRHKGIEEVHLVITGKQGWEREDLAVLAKRLDIEEAVHLYGYVAQNELVTLLAGARMLAMPSLYEGFGLPLVDAMELGVPVLTSNCSSMPEVTGDAAVLIDPYDVESIRDGMEKILVDDSLRKELVIRGQKRARQFSWQATADRTEEILRKAAYHSGRENR